MASGRTDTLFTAGGTERQFAEQGIGCITAPAVIFSDYVWRTTQAGFCGLANGDNCRPAVCGRRGNGGAAASNFFCGRLLR